MKNTSPAEMTELCEKVIASEGSTGPRVSPSSNQCTT